MGVASFGGSLDVELALFSIEVQPFHRVSTGFYVVGLFFSLVAVLLVGRLGAVGVVFEEIEVYVVGQFLNETKRCIGLLAEELD